MTIFPPRPRGPSQGLSRSSTGASLITFSWSRLTWPRLVSRQAGPCSRRMSASSRTGRTTTALSRRRLLSVLLCLPVARRVQALKRALDLGDQSGRHAGVASRRLELVVSNQRLNHPNVRAPLEQMGREGMAKRMKGERLAQPGGFRGLLEQSAELARGHWLMIATAGKQPALFRRNAGVMLGRPRLPPLPQQVEDLGRQHHVSVLAAFRLHDADDHLLTVDVARPQSRHLAGPQPATIGEG